MITAPQLMYYLICKNVKRIESMNYAYHPESETINKILEELKHSKNVYEAWESKQLKMLDDDIQDCGIHNLN